jgi:hypothetical protein
MINIIFDESSGSFFFTCKEEENMTLEEEIIIITQKIFALYAANMPGDSVDSFKKMAGYIMDVYEDKDCRGVLEELYEVNEETVFLNDESTEDAMLVLLKSLLDGIDEIESESDKMMIQLIAASYCSSLGMNIDELLNKELTDKNDNEEDLF